MSVSSDILNRLVVSEMSVDIATTERVAAERRCQDLQKWCQGLHVVDSTSRDRQTLLLNHRIQLLASQLDKLNAHTASVEAEYSRLKADKHGIKKIYLPLYMYKYIFCFYCR